MNFYFFRDLLEIEEGDDELEDIGDGDGNNDLYDDTDGIDITVGLGEEFREIWDEEGTEIGGEEATEMGGEEATEIGGVGIWLIGLNKVI